MIRRIIITAIAFITLTGCTTSTTSELSRYGFSNISPKREMLGKCLSKYGIQYRKKTGKDLVFINGYSVFDYCRVKVANTDFGVAG